MRSHPELVPDLDLGQRGIYRRHGGAQSPRVEQQHDELDPVRELEGHHVASTDSEFLELLGRGTRPRKEIGVVNARVPSEIAGPPGF